MTTTVIEFLIEMRMLEPQPQLRFPFILNILLLMWTVKSTNATMTHVMSSDVTAQ